MLLSVQERDERIQHGCRDRQKNLTPHIYAFPGPFQTVESNAGHCRSHHAQRHQPGQHVFAADIEMNSVFHSDAIITKTDALGNKK